MKMLYKECLISIKKSYKRFLSILFIVLLGVGFFAGIRATSPDMKKTLNNYFQETNFYDFQLISNYGITDEEVDKFIDLGYGVESSYSFDAIVEIEEEYAVKVMSYQDNKINKLVLKEGRLPDKNNECVLEINKYNENYEIGDVIHINDDKLTEKDLTIVGFVDSPLYISRERGNTKLLSGTIHYYLYTSKENINMDAYSEVYLTFDMDNKDVFSKEYESVRDQKQKEVEELFTSLNQERYDSIKADIQNEVKSAEENYEEEVKRVEPIINNPYVQQSIKDEITNQLNDAKEEIDKVKEEIDSMDDVETYVLDIESNIGFYEFQQDADRITNIAKLFPMVFFVVAILICLTSMTRMVEEERSQIGTLKSLGYNDQQIMFKYVLYALLATVIGSVIGVLIGFQIIPKVIFNMYQMMYTVPNFTCYFDLELTLLGTLLAVSCTLGATIYAVYKSLKEVPAELLRPKAPKPGKRVFLEHIPFIWKHLKFSQKVTTRNVFRYKKRFLMTIIGISGCTGLILAGFGLKDCITKMVPNQYEGIFSYEVDVTLKEGLTEEEQEDAYEKTLALNGVNQGLKVQKEAIEIDNYETNQQVQLVIPFGDTKDFIQLRNRQTGKSLTLKDGVLVSEKLGRLLALSKGDVLEISNGKSYSVKVDDFTENYLYHYIYMSKDIYKEDNFNTILLKTVEMDETREKEFAKELNETGYVSSILFHSATRSVFDSTMQNFGYVSLVLIVSAGLLAFVVLYNLASVNISERIRELASIKVLGFYDKEVYKYVSRETAILTAIGIFFGMFVGEILTNFIIKTCEIDMLMFAPEISISSYLSAIVITVVFTCLVNITTYFALKRIDMIESLKSVE